MNGYFIRGQLTNNQNDDVKLSCRLNLFQMKCRSSVSMLKNITEETDPSVLQKIYPVMLEKLLAATKD